MYYLAGVEDKTLSTRTSRLSVYYRKFEKLEKYFMRITHVKKKNCYLIKILLTSKTRTYVIVLVCDEIERCRSYSRGAKLYLLSYFVKKISK